MTTWQELQLQRAREHSHRRPPTIGSALFDATCVCIVLVVLAVMTNGCAEVRGDQVTNPARASYRVWVNSGGGRSGGSSTGVSPFLCVTNVHVVGPRAGQRVEVLHPLTQRKWIGEVVAADPSADVALVFVPAGNLDWTEIGDDPQPNQPCQLFGYGGDTVLKRGEGRFLRAGGSRGNGVPVWDSAVESISGDSGGGLFDEHGRLMAVNWGGEGPTKKSASTPASYVTKLGQRWLSVLSPEQVQLFGSGGCFGFGQCQPARPGGGGSVMPPKRPVRPEEAGPEITVPASPIAQRPPLVPIPQPPKITDEQIKTIASDLAAALKNDKAFVDSIKGAPGPAGPAGPPGPEGKPATVDYDQLATALLSKMPPTRIQFLDRDGRVVEQETFAFGAPIKFQPIHVQNFDSKGKQVDEEFYPYPGPIRLKDRPRQYTAP